MDNVGNYLSVFLYVHLQIRDYAHVEGTDEGGTGQCRSWMGVRSFLITHPALPFHSSWRIVAALVGARWRMPPLTTNRVRGWGRFRARAPRSAVQ